MSSPSALLSARVLNSLRTHLETDLSILGRVHYKNQSQHHLALFWRRVVEVDRVGRRLLPAWEAGTSDGTKQPDVRKLALLTERLFEAAFHLHSHALPILNLTHFLPLVTTLIAIASRVWSLCGVLYGHLAAVWARDFGWKKPLRPLQGWEDVPVASLELRKEEGSSMKALGLEETAAGARAGPSSAAGEVGEVISRSRTQTPSAPVRSSSASSALTLDVGERISRPARPSPLVASALASARPSPPPPVMRQPRRPSTPPSPPSPAPAASEAPSATFRPPAKSTAAGSMLVKDKSLKRALPADEISPESAPKPKKSSAQPDVTASPFDNLLVPKKVKMTSKREVNRAEAGLVKKKRKRPAGDVIDDIFG